MSYYNYCCDLLYPIYKCYKNMIIYSDNDIKNLYKNEIVPEIWRASWINWRNKINRNYNKIYVSVFMDGLFYMLKLDKIYYDNMTYPEITELVLNRKTYFPSDVYLIVEEIIPRLVYKISAVFEKIHCKKGIVKKILYKKFVMNNTYYTKEEIPLRKTIKNTDLFIADWVVSNHFYYDYKQPISIRIVK